MKRRRLSQEEIELWNKVVSKAQKLHPEQTVFKAAEAKPAVKKPVSNQSPTRPAPPRPAAQPKPPSPPPVAPLNMDRKAFGRMKRGKLVPEARIDLHGMTLDQAHPALTRFILGAQSSGKRLVLVITGKGKMEEDNILFARQRGVLKRQVPHWLQMSPLSHAVQQVSPAHIRHGGDGALYVYLRRQR